MVDEGIKRWVENNGGIYSKTIDEHVTHLICEEKTYKKNEGLVKQARRMRGIKIVSYEWLDDSLSRDSRKPLKETKYLWSKNLQHGKKLEAKKRVTRDQKERAEREYSLLSI